ncbi:NAD(P)/FAD-dependent oxidoreductase [bacterium]|nr:NAD(P)/FAD-dependent oxidoreductase [bacterium]MBU1995192.1 NAD(P)/FAD-dependent oxidoreductase [bacterium]
MKKIVVIGAGLGGLTAGALLSKKGFQVTVLEQHNIVGGCATTFKRKGGFVCEVGLHEMDGLYTDKVKNEIFKELGVYENIEFVKPNEFFRVKTDTVDFIMPDNIQGAKISLKNKYPECEKSIDNYFSLIQTIYFKLEKLSNMKWDDIVFFPLKYYEIIQYKNKSVREVFDDIFKNEELKLILNANIGYYHDNADTLSFFLHALAQYSYFNGGGWFIKGGSKKLSDYLASVIRQNGGTVFTNADVIKIDVRSKSVRYVKKHEEQILEYDILISNISPMQTYAMANIEYENKKELGNSILSVYLGFSKNLKDVYGEGAYSSFFLKNIQNIDDYNQSTKRDIQDRGFVFVDYSQIDAGLTSQEKSFGVMCTTDYLSDWDNLDTKQYLQKKEQILHAFVAELELHYPNIKEYIEFAEAATAKTMQRYLKTPNATAYGFAPTVKQFFKIPKSKSKKLSNLYFVGQWVLGGGFSPAINSAKLCCDTLLKDIKKA